MPHRVKILLDLFYDPAGRPGLGLFGFGTLLNIVHSISHENGLYYASMFSLVAGGSYYVLKIIFEFIKKRDK